MITPADKVDSNKPIKLQLSIHACFELSKTICRKPQFKWPYLTKFPFNGRFIYFGNLKKLNKTKISLVINVLY
jgi:hypothetical protein